MIEEAGEDKTNPSLDFLADDDHQAPSDHILDVTLMIKSNDADKLKTIADHYKLNHFSGLPGSEQHWFTSGDDCEMAADFEVPSHIQIIDPPLLSAQEDQFEDANEGDAD